jgi:GT2 family glycosyltransferase
MTGMIPDLTLSRKSRAEVAEEARGKTAFPQVSIVVVNTNELHHLKRNLPSLFNQNYPNFEVLVVDNVSTDGSIAYVESEFPRAKLIRNEDNLGYAGANNVGFQYCTGEYIAVLNPDTEVDKNWLIELIKALEDDPQAGLATPKILIMDQPEKINTCGNDITFTGITCCRGLDQNANNFQNIEIVSAVSGAAFVIKRSVLDRIGGFDESYFVYYEETDLSLRANLAGYRCLYVPTSVIYHKYAFRFSPRKAFYQERNRYYSLLKTFRWRTLLALLPSLIIGEFIAWGYAFMRGPAHLWSKFRTYLWILMHLGEIKRARENVQSLRSVDDRVILDRFGYQLNFNQTTAPWLAKAMDRLVNPLLLVMSRLSLSIITW